MARLTYANVMSTFAVFLALGGSAYAVARNSVKSRHIAPGAVKRSDIGRNAVTGSKVRNGSLSAADLRPGTLVAGPRGTDGAAGPKGDAGAPGERGAPGLPGATRVFRRDGNSSPSLAINTSITTTADCLPGEVATGGGFEQDAGNPGDFVVTASEAINIDADDPPERWSVTAYNTDEDNGGTGIITFAAVVMCASP